MRDLCTGTLNSAVASPLLGGSVVGAFEDHGWGGQGSGWSIDCTGKEVGSGGLRRGNGTGLAG